MKIKINKKVFNKFHHNFFAGIIYAKGIENKKSHKEINEIREDLTEFLQLEFHPDTLKNHQLINNWKTTEEKHESILAEKLKKALKGKIEKKNTVEDLTNFFMLKYLVPITAIAAKDTDYEFRLAKTNEKMGRTKLHKNELVFADNKIRIRKLGQSPGIKKETKKALIVIEALPPFSKRKMAMLLEEITGLMKTLCGGKYTYGVVSSENPRLIL